MSKRKAGKPVKTTNRRARNVPRAHAKDVAVRQVRIDELTPEQLAKMPIRDILQAKRLMLDQTWKVFAEDTLGEKLTTINKIHRGIMKPSERMEARLRSKLGLPVVVAMMGS